jgi:hypothetical protein
MPRRISEWSARRLPSTSRLSRLTAVGLLVVVAVAVIGPWAVGRSSSSSSRADATRYATLSEAQWVRPSLERALTVRQLRARLSALSLRASALGTLITVRAADGKVLYSSAGAWQRVPRGRSAPAGSPRALRVGAPVRRRADHG